MPRTLWLYLWCCLVIATQPTSSVKLQSDGGYEDVVIAVSSGIDEKEGDQLITNLKSVIHKTSELLYKSTGNRLYFKSATILLPNSWKQQPTYQPPTDGPLLHHQADVRILKTPPGSRKPYINTHQPLGCGSRGDYIEIGNDFFRKSASDGENPEYLLLKHWARLRFGVFEESGLPGSKVFPSVYKTKKGWKVTGCEHPYPWVYNDEAPCSVDDLPCEFELQKDAKINSSIMTGHDYLQANYFCSSNANSPHNTEAPTPHNAYCRHRSTWDVITSSEDYKAYSGTGPQTHPSVTPIRVMRRAHVKTVFVVDSNMCMMQQLASQTNTAAFSIAKALNDYTQPDAVGILLDDTVIYNGNTQTGKVSQIFNQACMNNRQRNVKLREGLEIASKMFQNASNAEPTFTNIILVKDGMRSIVSHLVKEFIEKARSDHLQFHVIGFPREMVDVGATSMYDIGILKDDLERPVSASCDIGARVEFDQVFRSIFDRYGDNFDATKTMVSRPVYSYQRSVIGDQKFSILGKTTMVVYACKPVEFIHPDFYWNGVQTRVGGEWYQGVYTSVYPLEVKVGPNNRFRFDSATLNDGYAITFWTETSKENFQFSTHVDTSTSSENAPSPPVIRVVTNLKNPQVLARVVDMSKGNAEPSYKISLLNFASQVETNTVFAKTYSRHFVGLSSEPKAYIVRITTTDQDGTYVITSFASFTTNLKTVDLQNFSPGRILDFRVEAIEPSTNAVTFGWTAPGVWFDSGAPVTAYHLRCGGAIDTGDSMRGYTKLGIVPQPSGTTETYTWNPPNPRNTYFCTVKSETQMMSEPSNMAPVCASCN